MRIGIYTLGCKVNQTESAAMGALLKERGHQLVDFHESAEVYIINTCAVTGESARKARQIIRQTKRRGGKVAVCGCYAQIESEAVQALGADMVGGSGNRSAFVEHLETMAALDIDNPFQRKDFELLPTIGESSRTRAFLKLEDGCHNFCTYCIIPYARGAVRSMPLDEAVKAAKGLAAEGYLEIVLTGIELSSWGRDLPGAPPLETLLCAICAAVPTVRIRLGSLEPRTITEAFCQALSVHSNLCPHFHLSLQSGCDKTLAAMGRKYDTARYAESLRLLRNYFDNPAITTDLIAGFPGENEVDFAQTMTFLSACRFAAIHVFPFSRRTGTPAAIMSEQCSETVKSQRAAEVRTLAAQMETAYLETHVGKTMEVLFEQEKDGFAEGYTANYLRVRVAAAMKKNSCCTVTFTTCEGTSLLGKLTEESIP